MDNESKIKDLESKNEELTKKLEDFTAKIEEIKTNLETHTHSGNDGSNYIYNDKISLKSGAGIATGTFGFLDYQTVDTQYGFMGIGVVASASNFSDNAKNDTQLVLEHQSSTNGDTNQTFYYGYRSPLYFGTGGIIASGGTTLTQTRFSWQTDELAGAKLLVWNTATPTEYDIYEITSNTATVITITGGTWTFTDSNADFAVFVPVYFGAAQYPWRRLYTTSSSGGGIRFGEGHTGSVQNSLLYFTGTKIVYRYNDAGTTRYKYLDLSGTGVTWVHTTTAP